MDAIQKLLGDHPTIWVFGYGSLLWKPDFRYKSKKIGFIKDYERRFYQGNVTFRGKHGQPGRVANLVEKKGNKAWGVAYEITGREEVTQVLQGLYTRETASGGYVTMVTTFFPRVERHHRHVVPVSRTNHSTIDSNESTNVYSNVHLHDHHLEFQSSLKRVDSNISDVSTDDFSSDEDYDLVNENARKAEAFTSSETDSETRFHIGNFDSLLTDHEDSVDSLMHYLHRFGSDSSKTKESLMETEIGEHSFHESLSFVHDPSKQRRPKDDDTEIELAALPVQVLLYTATPDNDLYLGPDDITSMARQIVGASGSAGSNVEYVTKIADYVRQYIPEDQDSHLFSLDAKVREEVYKQHAADSIRLQLGFADLSRDLHDMDHDVLAEAVVAS